LAVFSHAAYSQTILVVGDSLSAGYGIAEQETWVYLMQQRLQDSHPGVKVINASITGETTHGGLSRLPKALDQHQPNIVIIGLGGNDGLRGLSLESMHDNLSKMSRLSKNAGAKVLLLGVKLPLNYGLLYGKKFHHIYADVANREDIALVDFFLEGVAETRKLMQADGIHPSAAAQPRILENVWAGLVALF
jgi:acyl-CoA thioesterase-1